MEKDIHDELYRLQNANKDFKLRLANLENDISKLLKDRGLSPKQITEYFQKKEEINSLQEALSKSQEESQQLRSLVLNQSIQSDIISSEAHNRSNQMALDISQKYAEQQHIISSILLENAELKRTIALTEAENANLTVENCQLKARIENFQSSGNSSSQYIIKELEFKELTHNNSNEQILHEIENHNFSGNDLIYDSNEIEKKKKIIEEQATVISQLKKELNSALLQIQSSTNNSKVSNKSSDSINNQDYKTHLSQISNENSKLKKKIEKQKKELKIYHEIADNPTSEKGLIIAKQVEIEKLLKKVKELAKSKQDIVKENNKLLEQLAQFREDADSEDSFNSDVPSTNRNVSALSSQSHKNISTQQAIIQRAKDFILKIEFFRAKISAQISHLSLQIEHFSTTWNRLALVYDQHILSLPIQYNKC